MSEQGTTLEDRYRDFYTWTQEQARQLREARPNSVDWEGLAEEIEDLGSEQVNTVLSQLRNMLAHMLKAAYDPDAQSWRHWMGEIVEFRADAANHYRPSMRRDIEPGLGKEYERARQRALRHFDSDPGFPKTCPFTLDELLDEEIPPERHAERLSPGKAALAKDV